MIAPRDPRRARLASIRRRITDGTYETPEKLSAALGAWLDQQPEPGDGNSGAPQQAESPSENLRRRKPK